MSTTEHAYDIDTRPDAAIDLVDDLDEARGPDPQDRAVHTGRRLGSERNLLPEPEPLTVDEVAELGVPALEAEAGVEVPEVQHPTGWRRRIHAMLAVSDLVTVAIAVWLAQQVAIAVTGPPRSDAYWHGAVGLMLVWTVGLALTDSRDVRVIGSGPTEFRRVWDASFVTCGVVGLLVLGLRLPVDRELVVVALPIGVALLFGERLAWRLWLRRERRTGAYSSRVLLVGSEASVGRIAAELLRAPSSGYHVVGACTASGQIGGVLPGSDIPVMGHIGSIAAAMEASGADTVVVTSTDDLPSDKVREISWALKAGRQHLVLAPSIADVAGPRIHTRPVSGMPLIHVETPRFSRGARLVKRTFDIVASAAIIVVASPVLATIAMLVKASSPGPILYRQERIGLNGEPFAMLKFRSMRPGADQELAALLESQGTSQQPLFKIKNDPRITPIGSVLRKYSLDELPQLFNALGGSMSLVGPRPQIAAEVALYSDAARRRLLARPGLTGLWQVSGRSLLTWDEAVRLDLYYVENWSLIGDIAILARTVQAVVAPGESAH